MPFSIQRIWYQQNHPLSWALRPLSAVYGAVSAARRYAYRSGWLKSHRVPVPVIIVGNIVAGGSGKTPLVLYLCELLRRSGYQPGIVSRGYGGKASHWPQRVSVNSDPAQVGDEPVLLATRSGCPMQVGPDRVAAARALLQDFPCTVIIADDGLQHYALARDIEIALVDGVRRYGNQHLLPAGPLREPLRRLRTVDAVVCNSPAQTAAPAGEYVMQLEFNTVYSLRDPSRRQALADWYGQPVHAVAGIGHPERFFKQLAQAGVKPIAHPFPDHYHYRAEDLQFSPHLPLLMTEKDAVKCRQLDLSAIFENNEIWVVPVSARLETRFDDFILARMAALAR